MQFTVFLQSWDWSYGQTPEFEYTVTGSFVWGDVVSVLFPLSPVIP